MNAHPARGRADFLANVIDRAQARAAVAMPRPASLFESVAAPIHVPAVEIDETDGSTRDTEHGNESGSRRHLAPHAQPRDTQGHEERPSPAETAFATPAQRIPASSSIPLVREESHAPVRGPASTVEVPMAHVSRASNPFSPVAAIVQTVVSDAGKTEREADDAHAPVRLRGRFDANRQHADPVEGDQDRQAARLLPNVEAMRALAPAIATGQAPQHSHTSSSPPPSVVTISIGRVEVRAAAASTASSNVRPANARKPMRLDEYLDRKGRAR